MLPVLFNQGDYYNKHNIYFKKGLLPMEDKFHKAFMYQCQICGKVLTTKPGAMNHKCIDSIHKSKRRYEKYKHSIFLENLLRYIASSDTPYNAIDNDFLRNSIQIIDASFDIPCADKLCYEMDDLSERIHNMMLNEISGMTVSLLFDSIHRWSNDYQGLVIFTPKRLYLYGIIKTENSSAAEITNAVAPIISKLKENHTKVVSICCDNAKVNVKAFNGDDDSTQTISDSHFIRQPCSAHTSSLAIHDIFSEGKVYDFVVQAIKTLLSHGPKTSEDERQPKLLTIRWESLLQCTKYINKNYDYYFNSDDEKVIDSLTVVERIIGWENLQRIFQIVWNFISNVERDLTSIDQIIIPFIIAQNKLLRIPNQAAHDMASSLRSRFLKTCPLQLPLFAFLMTKRGLDYYRHYWQNDDDILKYSKIAIREYQMERGKSKSHCDKIENEFNNYITNFNLDKFLPFKYSVDMWKYYEDRYILISLSKSFIKLAKEVLSIPATEAAVERLFSHLSDITTGKMSNSEEKTINSRLIVKFDTIFKNAGSISWDNLASTKFS